MSGTERDDERTTPPDAATLRAALDERDVAFAMDRLARLLRAGGAGISEAGISLESAPPAPAAKPKRATRPNPSRLAKWEAAWQAEQDAEAGS